MRTAHPCYSTVGTELRIQVLGLRIQGICLFCPDLEFKPRNQHGRASTPVDVLLSCMETSLSEKKGSP